MSTSKVTYFGVFLAALLVLSGAAIVPILPQADATTTTIASNTTLPATSINPGDTLIINPGVTVTMSGTLTNNGNIVNSGTIQLAGNLLDNYGIVIETASGNISTGTINNHESGIFTEDAGAMHTYTESNFNNSGKHVAYGAIEMISQTMGIYTNSATGIFESHAAPLFTEFHNQGQATFYEGASLRQMSFGGGLLYTNGTIDNYGPLSVAHTFPGVYEIDEHGVLNNHPGAVIGTSTRPSVGTQTTIAGILNNEGKFDNKGEIEINGTLNNNGILENNLNPIGGSKTAVINNSGTFNNGPAGNVTNFSIINNVAAGTIDNNGLITNKCNAEFNDSGTFTGNPVVEDCAAFPVTHMSDTTAAAGYGVHSPKPARAEFVASNSQLIGDKIDSITLKLKRVGTISGTAEIGILDANNNIKELFGTVNVATLTTTYTDREFNLTGGELYTIQNGDRVGIKYTGGDASNWVAVMLDLDAADPFDGTNSYHQYRQSGAWLSNTDRDLYMILKQTHS